VFGCATILVSAQTSYPISRVVNHRESYSLNVERGSSLGFVYDEPTTAERDVFKLVNYERLKRGLRKLKWHPTLAKVAKNYSRRMAREDFFDHFDDDGHSVIERAEELNVKKWKKLGENLFFSEGYLSPTFLAVEGWLESSGHRKNMLDDEWTHTGIGVYEARDKQFYFTQVFMRK